MRMALFTYLIQEDQTFVCGLEAKFAFQSLKVYFMIAPLLIHVGPSIPFILETKIYDFALGAIRSWLGKNNLHLIDFHSYKFSPTKINYEIHDNELFVIMHAFKKWHHLLKGTQHEVIMYFDHKNL